MMVSNYAWNEESLYLVLTRTPTITAKAIRLFSGKRFSHISISDDDVLSTMYSFCRDRSKMPLPAHFNEERIEAGVFGKYGNIACEIYRIPITEEQHLEYKRMIAHFTRNRKTYRYNVFALVAILFHVQYEITTNFVCSVWVGLMLNAIGIVPNENKHLSLYEPEDFRQVPGASLVYEGNLKSYPKWASSARAVTRKGGSPNWIRPFMLSF